MFGHRNMLFLVFALIIASADRAQSQDQPRPAKSAVSEGTPDPCQAYGSDVGTHLQGPTVMQGRTVTPGLLINRVAPKYPKAARKAKIEGTVVICGVIGKDGKLRNLQAVSGPSELVPSAIKAVRQWVYKPYLLDGEIVEVDTTIHVSFKLN